MGWLRRRTATGFGLALLGMVGGFLGGLLRRRTPTDYVRDEMNLAERLAAAGEGRRLAVRRRLAEGMKPSAGTTAVLRT